MGATHPTGKKFHSLTKAGVVGGTGPLSAPDCFLHLFAVFGYRWVIDRVIDKFLWGEQKNWENVKSCLLKERRSFPHFASQEVLAPGSLLLCEKANTAGTCKPNIPT